VWFVFNLKFLFPKVEISKGILFSRIELGSPHFKVRVNYSKVPSQFYKKISRVLLEFSVCYGQSIIFPGIQMLSSKYHTSKKFKIKYILVVR
jgi:hypothetical protein